MGDEPQSLCVRGAARLGVADSIAALYLCIHICLILFYPFIDEEGTYIVQNIGRQNAPILLSRTKSGLLSTKTEKPYPTTTSREKEKKSSAQPDIFMTT